MLQIKQNRQTYTHNQIRSLLMRDTFAVLSLGYVDKSTYMHARTYKYTQHTHTTHIDKHTYTQKQTQSINTTHT